MLGKRITAKIINAAAITAVFCLLFACSNDEEYNGRFSLNPKELKGSFLDQRDGKRYLTVTIGGRTWMAENLNYSDGGKVGACYFYFTGNCNKYGRLYTWAEAMGIPKVYDTTLYYGIDVNRQGICPDGWHLPNNEEWIALENSVGGSSTAGIKLKSKGYWSYLGVGAGDDDYGFSALPGGRRNSDGDFFNLDYYGSWWSATEYNAKQARYRVMSYEYNSMYSNGWYLKSNSFSVRCIKD